MRHTLFFLFAILFCISAIELPYCNAVPKMDGVLDDSCWQALEWHSGFTVVQSGAKPSTDTRFKFFHNGDCVYFALEASEPNMAKLKAEPVSFDEAAIFTNDSFEIFFCPDPKKQVFYHILADTRGQKSDYMQADNNAGGYKSYSIWDSAAQIKVNKQADKWTMELALPLGTMSLTPGKWSFNVIRNRYCGAKREFATFSPNPHSLNARPETFAELTPANLDLSKYICNPSGIKATYKMENGLGMAKVTMRIGNNDKMLRIFRIKARLLSLQGKELACKEAYSGVGAASSEEVSLSFDNVKQGEYLLDCEFYDNRRQPCLLAKQRQEQTLEYVPMSIKLLSPCYRNNLYASMPDHTIEAQINFSEFMGKPFEVALLDEAGKILKSTSFQGAKATQTAKFDGKALPEGKYTLQAKCENAKTSVTICKLPHHKGEVWLDKTGVTHVDGKPFFPFGWYGHDDVDMPKPYLNSILDTSNFATMEYMDRVFKKRAAYPELMMVFPYQEFNPQGSWKVFSFKNRHGSMTAEQKELLMRNIKMLRDQPNLLGYYMADEPENQGTNPLWLQEVYELIRELDPWHPCIMLNWGVAGIQKYYKACDILMPDCYPTYYINGTTSKKRSCSSTWAKTSTSLRPAWQMPQVASWPAYNRSGVKGVPPNYDEIRSQFFQALIHNVKGFNMYAYFEAIRFPVLYMGGEAMGLTLMQLKDYLLPNTNQNALRVKTTPDMPEFQAGLKISGGRIAILAVNTEMKEVKADFTVTVPVGDTLYVAGENREVKLQKGKFSDTFAPGETHIYLNNKKMAEAVPGVAETKAAIEAARQARKKPGNLVGMGELLVADHIELNEGKLPPNAPKLTASSDHHNYFATKKTGSLYYLVDGILDPKRPEYAWGPEFKDKQPWLEVKLPAPATLGTLKLYTPRGNVEEGHVLVNGKTITFKNSKKLTEGRENVVIDVDLQGEKSDTVRIVFTKYTIKIFATAPEGRMLSEIELYAK
ncbi:MAG: hypothetical protein IJS08_02900 [Victivallales bacterium]|nr:hypothetical protein [Victivallales bacterium]